MAKLIDYKVRTHDVNKDLYEVPPKGSVTSVDDIVRDNEVRRIRIVFDDFTTLTLIRDESAKPGQEVDIYA